MTGLSTHVLDTVTGEPAVGMIVRLEQAGMGPIGRAVTDADGRIAGFGLVHLPAGIYRLVFQTGAYLAAAHPAWPPFFPEVTVTFTVDGARPHHHVPLLLSPHAYSTYRGI